MAFKAKNKKPTKQAPTLDLHGKTVDEVFDLVDGFIHKHMKAGTSRVRIMPGKGTGALKKELQRYLKLGGYPFEAETMSGGNKNAGSLIVFLND